MFFTSGCVAVLAKAMNFLRMPYLSPESMWHYYTARMKRDLWLQLRKTAMKTSNFKLLSTSELSILTVHKLFTHFTPFLLFIVYLLVNMFKITSHPQ